MNDISVKAPGKLMIMGEHAVLYGYPCIVTSIDRYLTVNLTRSSENVDIFLTPDVLDQRFLIQTVETFRMKYQLQKRVKISTKSELGQYGFGSSAATIVATLKALSLFFGISVTDQELFSLGLEIVLAVQGKGSGFDIATTMYGGTIYFNGKTKEVIPITKKSLPLLVVYSGVKADTVSLIRLVAQKRDNYKKGINSIFENIEKLVIEAKQAIEQSDWKRLGTLMNYNQNYLEDLGVSTDTLNKLVQVCLRGNVYGAKISGAGGGDCMIALVPDDKKQSLTHRIEQLGGEIIPMMTSVPGVQIL